MIVQSDYYGKKAQALHERERSIKAARGKIVDRNGIVLADNRSVCTVSVIHSQIRDPERVIAELAELLELPEDTVRKRVEKSVPLSGSVQMCQKKPVMRFLPGNWKV